MDLYDDLDTKQAEGWSSGLQLLQSQLQVKKATTNHSANINKQNIQQKKSLPLLTPLLRKKPDDEIQKNKKDYFSITKSQSQQITITKPLPPPTADIKVQDYEWDYGDEYNPLWPNEYEKLVKDKRDKDKERRDDRYRDRKRNARNNEEDEDSYPAPKKNSSAKGVAIAPPPSLQENTAISEPPTPPAVTESSVTIPYSASSVAAKIMAKYGFKDGQGLGKQEQGMSVALQVEKTSKKGGRIIHEKDLILLPPPPPPVPGPPTVNLPPTSLLPETESPPKQEPSITEIMKTPSKIVLLRNMVGPGDVDTELEDEVKDECNTKYGDVISVCITELVGTIPEETVRIFVEFKRMESAIKAVVDLNGRFFGGRQVRAGFFNYDKFKLKELFD